MTFALKIKYQYGDKAKDYINTNRTFTEQLLKQEMTDIFDKIDNHPSHSVVQINITLSNFQENKAITMNMFTLEDDTKQAKITATMQKLRDKFGIDIVKSGGEL